MSNEKHDRKMDLFEELPDNPDLDKKGRIAFITTPQFRRKRKHALRKNHM